MKYVIFGAGGVGTAIGVYLHQNGRDVALIARGEHLTAMRQKGIRMRTAERDLTVNIPAFASPGDVEWTGDEVVVLAMKSQDTPPALDALLASAGEGVRVVCAQNGVDNERSAARRFVHVYGMLVRLSGNLVSPGEVVVPFNDPIGVLDAGAYPRGLDDFIVQMCEDISKCQVISRPQEDIMRLKYGKLLINLHNATHVFSGDEGKLQVLVERLRREGRAVLDAAGIDYADLDELADRRRDVVSGPMAGFERGGSSTWQSLARGSRTVETGFINGEIVLLGRIHGIETPANALVQKILTGLARDRTPPGAVSVDQVLAQLPT